MARQNTDPERSPRQATIVKPEQALPIKPFGLDMKVLLTTEATGGALSVIMGCHEPGEGPPDHVHFSQEEVFFIVEGTYELTVGDQTSTAGFLDGLRHKARLTSSCWAWRSSGATSGGGRFCQRRSQRLPRPPTRSWR